MQDLIISSAPALHDPSISYIFLSSNVHQRNFRPRWSQENIRKLFGLRNWYPEYCLMIRYIFLHLISDLYIMLPSLSYNGFWAGHSDNTISDADELELIQKRSCTIYWSIKLEMQTAHVKSKVVDEVTSQIDPGGQMDETTSLLPTIICTRVCWTCMRKASSPNHGTFSLEEGQFQSHPPFQHFYSLIMLVRRIFVSQRIILLQILISADYEHKTGPQAVHRYRLRWNDWSRKLPSPSDNQIESL